jgi:iron complex outermembrane receptor protein
MKYLMLASLLICSFTAFSQKVTGTVKDAQGNPLPSATVFLMEIKDSSVTKMAISQLSGSYEFNNIRAGNYFVTASHTGYTTIKSQPFETNELGETKIPVIVMEKAGSSLQTVTITSKKPLVEVKADKMILNVEASINAAGSDALELLRKSPGVMVDRDDNISLSGKNGVQIFLDGRPLPLTGKDLADYLKSLNSASIEAIEIITNPSAKYDAAGNAGIINIRLKKNKTFGTNGSVTAGYSIGVFPKYTGGLSLNNRNKGFNIFGNYNYTSSNNVNFMTLRREQLDTLFEQGSNILTTLDAHNFKAGVDYFLNTSHTIGIMINGNISDNHFSNYSRTPISYIPTGKVDRILVADNTNEFKRKNLNYNLNYRFADTSGRTLNLDADYGSYQLRANQLQPNYYYDPENSNELYRVVNTMITPTNIKIYTVRVDYETGLKKGRLGVGGKTSFINTENNFERYNVNGNSKLLDLNRSNFFEYRENIHALYINYNRQFTGLMVQAGLRMENTNTDGLSYPLQSDGSIDKSGKQVFTRNYTGYFPSGALTFNKNPLSQWNFTYSRRIDRPAYQDLNPFELKLDEYTFQKGNIFLLPQYTNSFGITHTYQYKLNTTLNYSKVRDVHTQLVDTTEQSKSFLTKKNMATQDIISLNISYPLQLKWYTLFANMNTYYSHYIADFGPARKVDLDVFVFNIYIQHGFNFGKDWTGEISGWYVSPSIWQGFSKSSRMWSANAGLQKLILKGSGSLKVAVSDIFQSMRWKGVSNFAGQHIVSKGGWESRLLKLNLTWRFGNTQVKAARERKTGAEEEGKRVQEEGDGGRR